MVTEEQESLAAQLRVVLDAIVAVDIESEIHPRTGTSEH